MHLAWRPSAGAPPVGPPSQLPASAPLGAAMPAPRTTPAAGSAAAVQVQLEAPRLAGTGIVDPLAAALAAGTPVQGTHPDGNVERTWTGTNGRRRSSIDFKVRH